MAQQQQPDLKFKRGNAVIRDKIKAFAFALGCLLGDAGIKKNENRMCIEQADLGYVEWKKKMCVDLGLASKDSSIGEVERTRTDPVTNKVTKSKSHRFYTKSLFGDRNTRVPARGQSPLRDRRSPVGINPFMW